MNTPISQQIATHAAEAILTKIAEVAPKVTSTESLLQLAEAYAAVTSQSRSDAAKAPIRVY